MTDRISIGMDPATVRTVTYGVVAVSVVALAAFAMVQERGTYDMALGDGGLVIKVSKDEDLTTIIQRAVKLEDGKSDSSARAVLREEGIIVLDDADGGSEDSLTRTKLSEAGFFHIGGAGGNEDQLTRTKLTEAGYFRIGDDTLAKQLVELDYAEFEQMRDEFHKMLWDLRGPFEERTLSGASGTFLAAFEELYADLDENKRTTPLLDEMWRRSMAWETPFKRRSFSAAVELLPETAPADRIYACSGAEHLERKYVNVSIPAGMRGRSEAGGARHRDDREEGRHRREGLPLQGRRGNIGHAVGNIHALRDGTRAGPANRRPDRAAEPAARHPARFRPRTAFASSVRPSNGSDSGGWGRAAPG